MQINLITSNLSKVKEFKAILGDKVQINHLNIEYKELRSNNPEEIAKESAKRLADELNKTVVVEDSGLFIKALNDFPGTCSAYIHKRIGLKGILKLMENIEDRTCFYKSAVAYCEPNKQPISFLGEEKGTIALEEKGAHGFGHDTIFIPESSNKTYGEIEKCETIKRFRKIAIEKLKDCLEEQ
ncbi:non-canonical purine NTP pyrophosphatase, RdgB/HAM1 family [Candidatus Woesearchaeota archaeon]|jgi:XTP/dITP diphosphohydrolase|nr:non-canonical purine NTP pyrophosphatase, RdgB/HAM1 family [Candidatus Woesearchaeota archaeon]|tara:strand:+ start:894 stop:1442 length:549 start_codon:yes stop_codon:yes gene_type:complete